MCGERVGCVGLETSPVIMPPSYGGGTPVDQESTVARPPPSSPCRAIACNSLVFAVLDSLLACAQRDMQQGD